MKRLVGAAMSMAVVLVVGIALMHRASGPPASPPLRVSDVPPAPAMETSGPETVASEEPKTTVPVAGNDKPAETSPLEIAALREEVALLRAQVTAFERWRRTQKQIPVGKRPGSEADSAQAPQPDPMDPAVRVAIDRERQQQLAVIEGGFQREPADLRWATETEGVVQAVLASDSILQNTLLDLECRSRTCRVELADDNTGELAKGLPIALLQLAATLPSAKGHAGVDGAGGKTLILYLSQEAPAVPPPGR